MLKVNMSSSTFLLLLLRATAWKWKYKIACIVRIEEPRRQTTRTVDKRCQQMFGEWKADGGCRAQKAEYQTTAETSNNRKATHIARSRQKREFETPCKRKWGPERSKKGAGWKSVKEGAQSHPFRPEHYAQVPKQWGLSEWKNLVQIERKRASKETLTPRLKVKPKSRG